MQGVPVAVEKPGAETADLLRPALEASREKNIPFFGAHHSAYNDAVLWMKGQMKVNEDGSVTHPNHGKLEKIYLYKSDPYVAVNTAPEKQGTWHDAGINSMAEVGALVGDPRSVKVQDARFNNGVRGFCDESRAVVQGTFAGGEFVSITDWTRPLKSFSRGQTSQKDTILVFEDGTAYRMELVPQRVYKIGKFDSQTYKAGILVADFNGGVGRMQGEYARIYQHIVSVWNGLTEDNGELTMHYMEQLDRGRELALAATREHEPEFEDFEKVQFHSISKGKPRRSLFIGGRRATEQEILKRSKMRRLLRGDMQLGS